MVYVRAKRVRIHILVIINAWTARQIIQDLECASCHHHQLYKQFRFAHQFFDKTQLVYVSTMFESLISKKLKRFTQASLSIICIGLGVLTCFASRESLSVPGTRQLHPIQAYAQHPHWGKTVYSTASRKHR